MNNTYSVKIHWLSHPVETIEVKSKNASQAVISAVTFSSKKAFELYDNSKTKAVLVELK